MAKSSHGSVAKPRRSETKLRKLMAAKYVRFKPKRSAAQPKSGFNDTATALFIGARLLLPFQLGFFGEVEDIARDAAHCPWYTLKARKVVDVYYDRACR